MWMILKAYLNECINRTWWRCCGLISNIRKWYIYGTANNNFIENWET